MKAIFIFVILAFSLSSFAHSGNTDSSGCHHDRINGGYHCHNSKATPSRSISAEKSEMVSFNTKTKRIHRPNCKSAKACTVNCVSIAKDEAIQRGGVPCGNCGR